MTHDIDTAFKFVSLSVCPSRHGTANHAGDGVFLEGRASALPIFEPLLTSTPSVLRQPKSTRTVARGQGHVFKGTATPASNFGEPPT